MLLYIAFILCIVQYSNTSYSFILIDWLQTYSRAVEWWQPDWCRDVILAQT
jgi:hypothetical protein